MSYKFGSLGATDVTVGNFTNALADPVDKITGKSYVLPCFIEIETATPLPYSKSNQRDHRLI